MNMESIVSGLLQLLAVLATLTGKWQRYYQVINCT